MFDTPEVGEIIRDFMPVLKSYLDDIVQQQYDACIKGGFHLPKYYIWILYYKNNHTQKLVFRPAICRVTRPSPYQDEDMLLWSVTDYDHVKFEWAIPKKDKLKYILENPDKFDKAHVKMLRDYVEDRIEKPADYVVKDKPI